MLGGLGLIQCLCELELDILNDFMSGVTLNDGGLNRSLDPLFGVLRRVHLVNRFPCFLKCCLPTIKLGVELFNIGLFV